MSISNKVRQKRYKLKSETQLQLITENETGDHLHFTINDLSLRGLSAIRLNNLNSQVDMTQGELLPSSKIVGPEIEIPLGRLIFRHVGKNHVLGFSCVDTQLPIDGILSRYIDSLEINPHQLELNPDKFTVGDFSADQGQGKDILAKCRSYHIMLKDWEKRPGYQYKTIRSRSKGPRVSVTSQKKDVILMGSNDYLGLAAHPDVIRAAQNAIEEYGFGSTGSPLTTGQTVIHEELCEFIARFVKKEKAILFNSGYAANIGIVSGIGRTNDLLVADFLAHASLQDAMKLSPASSRFFKHNDLNHLEHILATKREEHAGCLIITEGIFSMDGDEPPLAGITKLANKYDCRLLLDEAHSLGVIGEKGQGTAIHQGCEDGVDLFMGTFSKCFGGIGGFVAGSKEICDWLYWFARSHMFSVSIPPGTAAAVLAAGKLIEREPKIIEKLKENISYFVNGLIEMGVDLRKNHSSSVIPVIIRDEKKMGVMNQYLLENGIFVVPIIFPAVKRTECRFRFTIMATHSISDLDLALHVFSNAAKKAGVTFDNH